MFNAPWSQINKVQDLIIQNSEKFLENVLLSSDVATMDAESEKLDELREDFAACFKLFEIKYWKTRRMLSTSRKVFVKKHKVFGANTVNSYNNILTQSKKNLKILKIHQSHEPVILIENSDNENDKNNHTSNVIMEIRQDDSDRSNPDVSDGYDFYGKEGPTQPNKFIMKSGKEDNESKTVELKEPTMSRTVTKKHEHKCYFCNYTTEKRYFLLCHMKLHYKKHTHENTVSKHGSNSHSLLQEHVNTQIGKTPYQCPSCDYTFTYSEELFRHVHYRHTYENPHKCTQCYYASTRPSDLKRHIKSLHTHSDKPIKCKRCDDVFPDLHTFKVHTKSHLKGKL